MSELRWLLLAAGILILGLVFWASRREASGKPILPPQLLRRRLPSLGVAIENSVAAGLSGPLRRSGAGPAANAVTRIVTVRLTGRGNATFAGEALIIALREAGLRHGRFGIFHRHDPKDEGQVLFSVASLVEPGSFDLTRLKAERFPGVSLFLELPGTGDGVAAFDDMLSTARSLARKLGGELLDENGSRLSVQRERYLREEVIQYQHKFAPP